MAHTYSVTEAQARFPAILREAEGTAVAITRRDKVVGYLVSPERMAAMLETLEIMADPRAMEAVSRAEKGRTRYRPLSVLDEKDSR